MPPKGYEPTNRVPIVYAEADAPQKGTFSYDGLNEEFLDQLMPKRGEIKEKHKLRMVVSRMKMRGTKWMLVDEAHHLMAELNQTEKERRRMKNQMEALKNVVNKTKCVMVLFGGSELLKCLNLSEQFATRTVVVTTQLYSGKLDAEMDEFEEHAEELLRHHGFSRRVYENDDFIANLMEDCSGSLGFLVESLTVCSGLLRTETEERVIEVLRDLLLSDESMKEAVTNDEVVREWIKLSASRTAKQFFYDRSEKSDSLIQLSNPGAPDPKRRSSRVGRLHVVREQLS